MIKKLTTITALILAGLLVSAKAALAAVAVSIVQLPQYTASDNFEISYSATAYSGSTFKEVKIEWSKEGSGWNTLGTYTENARKVQITPSQINQETKYYFRATAYGTDGSEASSQTSTTIDRTPPPAPESYSKEKISSQTYRLRWFNPNNDDVNQVWVYRSDTAGFTANSGTLIAQINVTKNTETSWENSVPDANRDYFYIIRGVDRAGNASDPKGDVVVVTETTTSTTTGGSNGQPASGNEQFPGQKLTVKTGTVLGEGADGQDEETSEVKGESTEDSQATDGQNQETTPAESSNKLWPILGLGALGIGVYWFLFRRK